MVNRYDFLGGILHDCRIPVALNLIVFLPHPVFIRSMASISMTYLKIQRAKTGDREVFFVNSFGEPYKEVGIRKTYQTACRRAGITDLRFHDLSHTFATRLIEKGYSLEQVGAILGHQDVRTTKRYSHPEKSLRAVIESLDEDDDDEPK